MAGKLTPHHVLETCLYATDLSAAEQFYKNVLGLTLLSKVKDRHAFFTLDTQVLLIFNPESTSIAPPPDAKLPVPPHGTTGQGHVCFSATADEITAWKHHLESNGIKIEADFMWPTGGRSIYFRDPAANCIEFAEPKIWGFDDTRHSKDAS